MSESEKPFACPSPGCNMSFVNEDHLTVHRKKHDMVLNLGSNGKGSNVFVADQTPTPTRFIRNCEEVGLFQDLQNVNPFEETFRRAVEAGKTGALVVPEVCISDDTLHTPHIFPHIADVQPSASDQDILHNRASDPPVINIEDTVEDVKDSNSNHSEKTKTLEEDGESQHSTGIVETIVVQEADTSIPTIVGDSRSSIQQKNQQHLSINGKEVQLLMKTEDGQLVQLSAIPVSQPQLDPTMTVNTQSNTATVVIKTEPSLNYAEMKQPTKSAASSRLSLAKMKLKEVLTKNGAGVGSQEKTESTNEITEDTGIITDRVIDPTRKQDILERNRASSMRARAKRKAWTQHLERSVHNVNEANAVLQLEVRALRAEVSKLKTLLLAHKDCPVTKAMEQGTSILLGPKVITLSRDVVQGRVPSVVAPTAKRVSVISTDIGEVLPRKKPLVSKNSNPMILPKTSVATFPPNVFVHGGKLARNLTAAIKVIDVDQTQQQIVTTRRKEGKQQQILIVQQNQKRKFTENPRQIIRINPNFELDNAASKSTGS
ncbi:cyclic AMP-dependent transcription factor ATF-2 [Athalia rosae]|uniref:cyclic AMP-dependent transcription factor ATF-2 n=1 Tax=Athalia rosae TaxID=37344 RepID=UPI00203358D2|nr:cyclic AMP-dependent transcription factor ATF-2 [Athalia rosae]